MQERVQEFGCFLAEGRQAGPFATTAHPQHDIEPLNLPTAPAHYFPQSTLHVVAINSPLEMLFADHESDSADCADGSHHEQLDVLRIEAPPVAKHSCEGGRAGESVAPVGADCDERTCRP
jgi:hypothetical protein